MSLHIREQKEIWFLRIREKFAFKIGDSKLAFETAHWFTTKQVNVTVALEEVPFFGGLGYTLNIDDPHNEIEHKNFDKFQMDLAKILELKESNGKFFINAVGE